MVTSHAPTTTDVTHTPTGTAIRGLKLGIFARILGDICWPWKPRKSSMSLKTGISPVMSLFYECSKYLCRFFLVLTVAVIVIDTVYSIKEHMINFSRSSRLNHWHWGNRKIYPVREITWKVWGRISDSAGSTKHTDTSIPRMPCIFTKKLLKFVPKGPIDIKPALVQIIAWCRISDKPLSEPKLTRFTDVYMRH